MGKIAFMNVSVKSDKVAVDREVHAVYVFLSDFRNFEHLMPEQVVNWKATESECSFTIKNMGDVAMKMSEKDMDSRIVVTSAGTMPFGFDLKVILEPADAEKSFVLITLEAQMSAMLKMMAKRPLQNLVDHMAGKIQAYYQSPS